MKRKSLHTWLFAGLVLAAAGGNALAAGSLKELLDKSGVKYIQQDTAFLIPVSAEGETTMVTATEAALGELAELKLVYLFTPILEVPKGFKHPQPMLKKIAELNEKLLVGKLGLEADSGCLYFISSFWLRTADKTTVEIELAVAHVQRQSLRKELEPYLQG